MKTFLVITLAIFSVNTCSCFLTYPFSGHVLDEILGGLNVSRDNFDTTIMKHAIDGEKCVRECKENDRRVCQFNFTLKHYQVMGGSCGDCSKENIDKCFDNRCVVADGVGRGFLAINYKLPGPKIQVCKDDVIVVDFHNDAEGLSTTLHWHGLRQFGTQFMDGVPYLTQCPVPFGESFRYSFHAADEGTHFYHSHAGHHKTDGMYGALVVRGFDKNNPNRKTYDHDEPHHTILMADWMHQSAGDYIPGLIKRSVLSQSILINGHGRYYNHSTKESTFAPLSIFHVEAGSRYRFRVINAAINVCAFLLQIEDHNFTIIATETSYVKPMDIGTLYSMGGERYDFVVDTKDHAVRDYWIRFRSLKPCVQKLEGFAILRYHKKLDRNNISTVQFNERVPPHYDQEYPNGTMLNKPIASETDLTITSLEDFRVDKEITEGPADKSEFIFFDIPTIPNIELYSYPLMERMMFVTNSQGNSFIATANNISFQYPSFPLLLEPDRVNDDLFCDGESVRNKKCPQFENIFGLKKICRCIHRIKFKLNSIAEIIIVNIVDSAVHSMHLHGHKFHVMDTGALKEMTVEEAKYAIPKTNPFKRPPYKDTVIHPGPGYVRLRFRANNPGYWIFHCHMDWHLSIGMSVMIQVGEVHEMRRPPDDFPRCGDYMPNGIV